MGDWLCCGVITLTFYTVDYPAPEAVPPQVIDVADDK